MDLTRYLNPEIVRQVSRLDLRARFIVEGFLAGSHRSPFQGLSVEFAEHRKYTQGDDLRTIDWNVFARTDRLYVRKYQAETHLECHLLVDTSASMGAVGPIGGADSDHNAKLMYAVHLAAALGYLVIHQQDAIGLGLIGAGLQTLLPARSRRAHLAQLLATLSSVTPSGETGLARGVDEALARIRHRGVIVLISDLLAEPEDVRRALRQIRYRGHDLIVMHILDAVEARFTLDGTVRLEDPESGETLTVDADAVRAAYRTAIAEWRGELRREISSMRGDYVALDTATPFDTALVEFLTQRSKRR